MYTNTPFGVPLGLVIIKLLFSTLVLSPLALTSKMLPRSNSNVTLGKLAFIGIVIFPVAISSDVYLNWFSYCSPSSLLALLPRLLPHLIQSSFVVFSVTVKWKVASL